MKYALAPFLTILLFVPLMAFAQTEPVDLTRVFIDGGITIDRLLVYQINDIILIRGRTDDPAEAAAAVRFAASRGYRRVANLIEIVPAIGDAGIERQARHQLETSRALAGCTFQLDSLDGILRLRGQVLSEIQKGYAVRMISKIDGVKEVKSVLTLSDPSKGRS